MAHDQSLITQLPPMNPRRKSARKASADQLAFVFTDDPPYCTCEEPLEEASTPVACTLVPQRPAAQSAVKAKRTPRVRKPARANVIALHHDDRRLTVEEAAELLCVSVKTLEAWRRLGKGPMFVKLGRSVRYTMRALDQFTRERTVRNSAEGRMLDANR